MANFSGFMAIGNQTAGFFTECVLAGYARKPITFTRSMGGHAQGIGAPISFTTTGVQTTYNSFAFFTLVSTGSPVLVYPTIHTFSFGIKTSPLTVSPTSMVVNYLDGVTRDGEPIDAGGAVIIAGITNPGFSGNLVSDIGYQQNGGVVLNQTNVAQGSLTVGLNAGAALPASSIFSTFVGWGAGQRVTGPTSEATLIGTIAGQFLTTGTFCTAVGENAMGREVTANSSTAIGNDAQRSYVSSGANTTVGKSSMITGGGASNSTLGFAALQGNSSVVTFGGSATLNDVITLTFTGTFTGSPQSQAITVTAGQTLAQMATAMVTALNANPLIFNTALNATAASASGAQLSFLWPGTATTGFAIVITSGVTGAGTETVTVTSSGATGNDNVAIGAQAMQGQYTLSTAFSNVAIGTNALSTISSGQGNIAIGIGTGNSISSGLLNILVGNASGNSLTTSQGSVAIGSSALQAMTTNSGVAVGQNAAQNATGTGGTFVGNNAGRNIVGGANNTALGSTALQAAAASSAAFNVAIGDSALQVVTSAAQNIAIGHITGNKLTSGALNVMIGPGVASTTLTTGNDNILIGIDSSTDTAASGTSDTVLIKGKSGGIAVLSSTGTNGTPTTIMGGILGVTPTNAITAHAGGTQAAALALTTGINNVTIVGTAADSVRLPVSVAGMQVTVINSSATSLQLYGAGTDTINAVATATGVAVAGGKTSIWTCPVAGSWFGGSLA